MAHVLGIDIGGTGVKGAPVDTATGQMMAERHKLPTPQPSTPKAVIEVAAQVVRAFDWTGPAGVTFPGVVAGGVIRTAANLDHSWIGVDAVKEFGAGTKLTVTVLNDADAAGIAEMRYGAGKGVSGTVLLLTLGTGIGSALFIDGVLVPNTEFGHIEVRGREAELRAAGRIKVEGNLSWDTWADELNLVLQELHLLLW